MPCKYICTEGDTDRVVLRSLVAADDTVLPEPPKPNSSHEPRPAGKEAAIDFAVGLIRGGRDPVFVALDIDDRDPAGLYDWVERELRARKVDFSGASGKYRSGSTSLRVVPIGAPGDKRLVALGITSFSVDDFLLLLTLNPQSWDTFLRIDRLRGPTSDRVPDILRATVDLWRSEGVIINRSKQMLDILMAVSGFRASPARMAEMLLQAAPEPFRADTLAPISALLTP
ncbi:MAG: hypothetical protein HYY93_11885 [Planctomycetes bacterium]|nr:hypothetical protein [Planctomycetota bacterium]